MVIKECLQFTKKYNDLKLLHTADWHLGQTFFEYDRRLEHSLFLEWLREQVGIHGIDVLLIAGDVFDGPNPSADSQRMYYRFLREVTAENPELQVVIIAGNHDSAARLEAPHALLEMINVTVRGVVKRGVNGEIDFEHFVVPLNKGGYCLAVPYLRQGDYPEAESYAQGVRKMYEGVFQCVKGKVGPLVAMGHLQATGSEISEHDRSERTVIGGLECVSPDSFDREIAYTALGHLHRAQRVSGRENVRYAGAPLPMSFAEKNNRQGVTLVEIADGMPRMERLPFEAPVRLLSIPAEAMPLEEVLESIRELPDGELTGRSPYLEIKVLISGPEPSLRHRIEEALKGKSVRLARLAAVTPQRDSEVKVMTYEELRTIDPLEMADDVFQRRYGGAAMPEEMKELLQGVIREVGR